MARCRASGRNAPIPINARFSCISWAGFSLLEMAVVLLLISIGTGLGLQFWAHQGGENCTRSTPDELATMQNAIDQFVAANGRYPLPASRRLGTSDPAYGREVTDPFDTSIVRIPQASPVLLGAVPHVTLNLPTELASDCWGNKFTYAVSQNFTNAAGYSNTANFGGIILRYGAIAGTQELESEAAYVIVSHGADALGATAANYTGPEINCNSVATNLAQPRIDKENCDTINSIFHLSEINTTKPELYFDDYVVVANRITSPSDCAASTVNWGSHCYGNALLTLGGLSVNVTNIAAGYTGLAVSTCTNGNRTTLGVCLPVGACIYNNPRTGAATAILTLTSMNYGQGICKTYKCCSGTVSITPLVPCLTSLDVPGIALSCP